MLFDNFKTGFISLNIVSIAALYVLMKCLSSSLVTRLSLLVPIMPYVFLLLVNFDAVYGPGKTQCENSLSTQDNRRNFICFFKFLQDITSVEAFKIVLID